MIPYTMTYHLKIFATRGAKAVKLVRRSRWRNAMTRGVAATVEHDRLPLDRNYRTVIDVGANRGQFALYARERFPRARIYSIEPLSGPRASIRQLFEGDGNVHVLDFAAGAIAGSAVINITHHDDSSSLLPPSHLQTSRFPGTHTEATETVAVRSLDEALNGEMLEQPILLKVDVQGFELEVLKGAANLLARVDAVMTECSFVEFYEGQALFDDIYALLRKQGFQLSGGAMSASTGATWEQGDFVFKRAV